MSDDLNRIAAIEKAISERYGDDAVQNPKANWDEEKEKEYIEQSKEFYKKIQSLEEKSEKVEVDGIFIPKKLLSKKSNRTCPTCSAYSFKLVDDVYMNKYDCCYDCFIQYVDGREARWQSGWGPQGE